MYRIPDILLNRIPKSWPDILFNRISGTSLGALHLQPGASALLGYELGAVVASESKRCRCIQMQGCVELEDGSKFEHVDKFCYLGDMLCAGGEAEEASRTRVRSAWEKFNEVASVLTKKVKLKRKIYYVCVQRVLVYGSETWAKKVEGWGGLRGWWWFRHWRSGYRAFAVSGPHVWNSLPTEIRYLMRGLTNTLYYYYYYYSWLSE